MLYSSCCDVMGEWVRLMPYDPGGANAFGVSIDPSSHGGPKYDPVLDHAGEKNPCGAPEATGVGGASHRPSPSAYGVEGGDVRGGVGLWGVDRTNSCCLRYRSLRDDFGVPPSRKSSGVTPTGRWGS